MSWVGIRIRKGKKLGTVVSDDNGFMRVLTVRFEDGSKEYIRLNNIGADPRAVHDFEWFVDREGSPLDQTWQRF